MKTEEIVNAITDWLKGEGEWKLDKESEIYEDRLHFRQNLLITLKKYAEHEQTPEEKELGFKDNVVLREKETKLFDMQHFDAIGGLTYSEQTNFRNKYVLKFSETPHLTIEFLVDKKTAKEIVDKFSPINPELIKKPVLKEPDKKNIEDATKNWEKTNKVKHYIKLESKLYNASRVYLIARALANGINNDYISPYYTSSYIPPLTKYFELFNKDGQKVNINQKGDNMPTIEDKIELLKHQKQIILQGPPGTGKTRVAKIIAINMLNDNNPITNDASNDDIKKAFDALGEKAKLIQFHPSYSYEDFVRGITAKTVQYDNSSSINYVVENKVLAQMAKDALKDKKQYILIIDEINRANLSSVLGELIYALEYRDEAVESMYELKENDKKTREIILPSNLYIIGTMNTADRSVGHIDYAIRRRFTFVDVLPQEIDGMSDKFKEVKALFVNEDDNRSEYLSQEFNPYDVMPGHSYFLGDGQDKKLEYQVIPLLKEYIKDGVLKENALKKINEL